MLITRRIASVLCLLAALTWAGAAQAQAPYWLTGNSGGQLQIGTGLPLPIGPSGIFLGGQTAGTAGTFPPLSVPPATNISTGGNVTRWIEQDNATAQGGAIKIPTGALSRPAAGTPVPIGVFTTNPTVFQVATSIDYAWPAATATLAPGGAPGPAVLGTGLGGGIIAYSGGSKAFGGPGRFAIAAGIGAAGGRVPPNTTGMLPVASVWINFAGGLPATAMAIAIVGASNAAGVAEAGAPVASPAGTTAFGPLTPSAGPFGALNFATGVTPTPMGLIPASIPLPTIMTPGGGTLAGLSNMVTASKGFPWTTGFITVSQGAAVPPEVFFLSGTDTRVAGAGNVSLVSGALSLRALSGPNANRGWLSLTLPEPGAAMGAAGALAALALCHGLVRRRKR